MSIFDLLLAEALAAGVARMAEDRQEPTPENFFVLPVDPEAWRKLYANCTKEGLVICVEITKESHSPSSNTHPHFLDLARRVPNIPFVQVKTSFGKTFDKVREDLGGADTAPTLIIALFDGPKIRINQVVGEEKIKLGIRIGAIESVIKDFLEQRARNKHAEEMAEKLAGVLMGDIEKRRRREYEENLKKEQDDLERRLKENKEQRLEEQMKEKKIDEIRSMDLQKAKIGDIKTKMDELKISHVGAISREDLIQQIKKAIPNLSSYTKSNSDLLSNYITSSRHTEDVSILAKTDKHTETGDSKHVTVLRQDDILLQTRMLYACTLHDMDILGRIARKEEGVVVRAKCTKPGIPNPDHIYAMKIILNIHNTSTLTKVQTEFKNEYDILSGLPIHKNVIQMFAFFYDRPQAYDPLKYLPEGIALCLLMENLSQDMQEHIDNLNMAKGPKAVISIQWLKDVVCGLQFLFHHHVVHRDMKLENLLLSGDSIKISDFGAAICLDSEMKLPFAYVAPRGGNEAHLAPEILNPRPGAGKFLNYTKQPVWEAGILAYELTGHRSPFERTSIDQKAYNVSSLPPLEKTHSKVPRDKEYLPNTFTILVQSMLEYFPDNRPSLDEMSDKLMAIT